MSYGHGRTLASVEGPRGTVSAPCVVAWVACDGDGCEEMKTVVGGEDAEDNALCDGLAHGWVQSADGRDWCPACWAKGMVPCGST